MSGKSPPASSLQRPSHIQLPDIPYPPYPHHGPQHQVHSSQRPANIQPSVPMNNNTQQNPMQRVAPQQRSHQSLPNPSARAVAAASKPAPQTDYDKTVIEYLLKKGYTKTEAQLRAESQAEAGGNQALPKQAAARVELYSKGFQNLKSWIDGALDIYQPELRRILWPVFVYTYLHLIMQQHIESSKAFFDKFANDFQAEHQDELRQFKPLNSPAHIEELSLAKKFRQNKYRLTLSRMGYELLTQHLEENAKDGGTFITNIISASLNVNTVERAVDDKHSLRQMLKRSQVKEDFPQEDEGIPGHNPGSANLDQRATTTVLQRLKLGPLPMEEELLEDVLAELQEEDQARPPNEGDLSLTDHMKGMIKVEEGDETPSRHDLPLPQSRSRDVVMEIQKVREHRARFKIESRTGGMAPPVSVCMFTFHNSNDAINCVEFSGDNQLVAAGMAEHYIRVARVDGKPMPSAIESGQVQSCRRLVGHHGPVYGLSFSPAIESPGGAAGENGTRNVPLTTSQHLLSSSSDRTIRLWDLGSYTCLAVYEGHRGSVWDVQWGPFGYYFVTGSRDGTARLWSTEHKTELRLFVGHEQDVNYVAFHPNNAYVFTAGFDKTVRMWSVMNGQAVRMFSGHAGDLTSLACAPNGKLLASGDDTGTIIIWDLGPGKILKRLRGHDKGGLHSLSFNVESNVLISGGQDGTVRVWDIQGSIDPAQQGKVIGEGGTGQKMDLAQSGATGTKKKAKEAVVSADQISAFPTKKTPVYKVVFNRMNLAMAAGSYLP